MRTHWIALLPVLVAVQVLAGEGQSLAPLRDPWVPRDARQVPQGASSQPPTQGAALKAQVERKLRERFEAADVQRRGSISRDEARAAGLGAVLENFDAIDDRRAGRVSFDDYARFLRRQGATTF